jgi:hypothetical protein
MLQMPHPKMTRCIGYIFILMTLFIGLTYAEKMKKSCDNLSKISNIYDLMRQIHGALASHCLFEIPVHDLETRWGVRILDRTGPYEKWPAPDSHTGIYGPLFYGKPYGEGVEAFYIAKERDVRSGREFFYVGITDQYKRRNGTLFPSGEFPKLPPPEKKRSQPMPSGPPMTVEQFQERQKWAQQIGARFGQYESNTYYYWRTGGGAMFMRTQDVASIGRIEAWDSAELAMEKMEY